MNKIGIVGMGYVGQAVASAYTEKVKEVVCVDIIEEKSTHKFNDLFKTDAIFICVPSPMKSDGSCNADILIDTLDKLKKYKKTIISKTTALPSIYEKLGNEYYNLVHVPEFLTAHNNIKDYANETGAIIGASDDDSRVLALQILKLGQSKLTSFYTCSLKEAAFAKYVENCFLATKVIFMNEMASLANKINLDWDKIRRILEKDPRVGLSHCKVPGHDGLLGFGGVCFPKDTSAFLHYAKSLNIDLSLLQLAVNKNRIIRNEDN